MGTLFVGNGRGLKVQGCIHNASGVCGVSEDIWGTEPEFDWDGTCKGFCMGENPEDVCDYFEK